MSRMIGRTFVSAPHHVVRKLRWEGEWMVGLPYSAQVTED